MKIIKNIFGLLVFGITGMGYVIALVLAIWPKQSALFDPLWNNN